MGVGDADHEVRSFLGNILEVGLFKRPTYGVEIPGLIAPEMRVLTVGIVDRDWLHSQREENIFAFGNEADDALGRLRKRDRRARRIGDGQVTGGRRGVARRGRRRTGCRGSARRWFSG